MHDPDEILRKLQNIQKKIKTITDRSIQIIAVTKRHPLPVLHACLESGISHIAENRSDELLNKLHGDSSLYKKSKIHFIGNLQSRKVASLINQIHSLDTLASLKTLKEIEKHRNQNSPLHVLIQINATGEENKSGIAIQDQEEILALCDAALHCHPVKLEGLMTMGPTPENMGRKEWLQSTRRVFQKTKVLKDQLENKLNIYLPRLSMGMSNDLEIAIQAGCTQVRIGRGIFGDRK